MNENGSNDRLHDGHFTSNWFWCDLTDEQRDEVRDWMAEHGYDLRANSQTDPMVIDIELRPEAPMLIRRWGRDRSGVLIDEVTLVALPPVSMLQRQRDV